VVVQLVNLHIQNPLGLTFAPEAFSNLFSQTAIGNPAKIEPLLSFWTLGKRAIGQQLCVFLPKKPGLA
jgi:hypothetical protein